MRALLTLRKCCTPALAFSSKRRQDCALLPDGGRRLLIFPASDISRAPLATILSHLRATPAGASNDGHLSSPGDDTTSADGAGDKLWAWADDVNIFILGRRVKARLMF